MDGSIKIGGAAGAPARSQSCYCVTLWTDHVAGAPGCGFNADWTSRESEQAAADLTISTEVGPLVARIGEELLFQYPEGDADVVTLLATSPLTAADQVEVSLPDGRTRLVDPAFLSSLRPDPADRS